MSLTPHGPGFSFLDSFEVLEAGKRGRGRKWLDPAAPFFADHFPGNPIMPGVLLVECAAQAAGVLWGRDREVAPTTTTAQAGGTLPTATTTTPARRSDLPVATFFLAAVQHFRFRKPVLPGQTLEIEVSLEKELGAFAQFDAVLRVGETPVATGKITLSRRLEGHAPS
jgi:3-hydroxyacyl-[acyl-carrier-protein] dehydratase